MLSHVTTQFREYSPAVVPAHQSQEVQSAILGLGIRECIHQCRLGSQGLVGNGHVDGHHVLQETMGRREGGRGEGGREREGGGKGEGGRKGGGREGEREGGGGLWEGR